MFVMVNKNTRHILAASEKDIPWQVPDFAEKIEIAGTVPEPAPRHMLTSSGRVISIPGKQWPDARPTVAKLADLLVKKNLITNNERQELGRDD